MTDKIKDYKPKYESYKQYEDVLWDGRRNDLIKLELGLDENHGLIHLHNDKRIDCYLNLKDMTDWSEDKIMKVLNAISRSFWVRKKRERLGMA